MSIDVTIDERQLMFSDVGEPQTREEPLYPVRESQTAKIIDRLKLRGTPIDMIDSYLLAGEPDAASDALKAVILESVYEHLSADKALKVSFTSKQNLTIPQPKGSIFTSYVFSGATTILPNNRVGEGTQVVYQPRVQQITVKQVAQNVGDVLRATILNHITTITLKLIAQIEETLNRRRPNETLYVRLYPVWSRGFFSSVFPLDVLPIQSIGAQVTIGISAYSLTS